MRSPPVTSRHFSSLRNLSGSSMTLNGRQSWRERSRPSMAPRMYNVRSMRSQRKPRLRPACANVSGDVGASGNPAPSQSSPSFIFFAANMVPRLGATRWSLPPHDDVKRQAHAHGRHLEHAPLVTHRPLDGRPEAARDEHGRGRGRGYERGGCVNGGGDEGEDEEGHAQDG